jgi:hypothetical protein
MTQRTTKIKSFKIAYFLDQKGIERIVCILKESSPELKLTIECSDGSSIEFSAPEELFEFTNSELRRMQSLTLTTPWGKEPLINLRFRSSKYLPSIEYEISGDDKNVFYYSGKLDECISTYRLWYTPFAFLDFIYVLVGGVLIGIVTLLLWAFFSMRDSELSQTVNDKKTYRAIFEQIVFWLSLSSIFLIGAGANFFRNRLFPISNFLIGEGISRFNRLEFRRRTIGIGFILSIIASVVATLLMR